MWPSTPTPAAPPCRAGTATATGTCRGEPGKPEACCGPGERAQAARRRSAAGDTPVPGFGRQVHEAVLIGVGPQPLEGRALGGERLAAGRDVDGHADLVQRAARDCRRYAARRGRSRPDVR